MLRQIASNSKSKQSDRIADGDWIGVIKIWNIEENIRLDWSETVERSFSNLKLAIYAVLLQVEKNCGLWNQKMDKKKEMFDSDFHGFLCNFCTLLNFTILFNFS